MKETPQTKEHTDLSFIISKALENSPNIEAWIFITFTPNGMPHITSNIEGEEEMKGALAFLSEVESVAKNEHQTPETN